MEIANVISAEMIGAPRLRETADSSAVLARILAAVEGSPVKSAPPASEPVRDPSREIELIERMREGFERASNSRLLIDRDEEAGRFIYRIMDPETGETMRQWPPERYLELVAYLNDKRGGLLDENA